ncbi:MAG: hypothetical protein M3126_05000 [Candidatus Eremiobacteraeota bacterium]|nr:hypothetical protein [Candidatus Eremiobacteraeota bacterium]
MSGYQTWRFDRDLAPEERADFAASVAAEGASCALLSSALFATTYALLNLPPQARASGLAARYPSAIKNEPAIIALGIEPEAADALHALHESLGGAGAPAGVTRVVVRERALVIEFDPQVTPWQVVNALIGAELKRFGSTTRTTTLLSPLSAEMETAIAAAGLECPELEIGRILEVLVRDAGR